jgi:endonuclease/exonuclease/phosphatase family metal-dependent hydrolase
MFTEIDLPDGTYVGDLVIGNAHLKAFSSGHIQRITAAKNVAYYVDYVFNGAGTGVADPRGSVRRLPASTVILGPNTPVVLGGDWNEDEVKNGTQRGPADWLTQAEVVGGADGTDADRSDMTYDTAVDLITASRVTQSSSKLDYIAWQDSIAVARQAFVFNTQSFAQAPNWMPVAFDGVPRPTGLSTTASDHLPVIVDLMLPRAAPTVCGDANCDGVLDFFDIDPFVLALIRGESVWEAQFDCDYLSANDIDRDGDVGFFDVDPFVAALLGGGCE